MPRSGRRALWGGVQNVLLVALPAGLLAFLFAYGVGEGELGIDFRRAFLTAAHEIAAGRSPYELLDDPSRFQRTEYLYPPLTAVLLVPFTIVPDVVVTVGFTLLLGAAVLLTLRVLDVRDWRCYSLALAWPPVLSALQTGNLTILLGLAAAVAWRLRDRVATTGVAIGVSLAAKLFFWPLLVWLAFTGRLRAAAVGVATAVALLAASWSVIGFAGLLEFPGMLSRATSYQEDITYTPFALGVDLGLSAGVAHAVGPLVGVVLLAACALVARRGDDRTAFLLAVAAAIVLSPIVWLHYFALLLLPVALAFPRLSVVWFLPFLLFGGDGSFKGETWQLALTLATAALVFGLSLERTTAAWRRVYPVSRTTTATASSS